MGRKGEIVKKVTLIYEIPFCHHTCKQAVQCINTKKNYVIPQPVTLSYVVHYNKARFFLLADLQDFFSDLGSGGQKK